MDYETFQKLATEWAVEIFKFDKEILPMERRSDGNDENWFWESVFSALLQRFTEEYL